MSGVKKMQNYKLTLCYDGTKYRGWQRQGNTPNTIQENMEYLLSRVLGRETEIAASGRTDAGVHARRQVCSFRAEMDAEPEELLRKLVLAASSVGDVVLDPFSGSGTTAVVAEQLQRVWLGCDLSAEYNSWAIDRIDHVIPRTIDQWTAVDRENAKRRESIR